MNKRILDGAGLWKSDKLARMQPEWMRAEYANLIPLALANGVLEADTRRIWATVYSYNRPEISFEDVEEIKRELCRVGLLFLWPDEQSGKIWAYFTGIDKLGRLLSRSRLDKKHEPIGPNPPADALRSYIELTRSKPLESSVVSQWLANGCLGFGIGIGLGTGKTISEPTAPRERSTSLPLAEGFEDFYQAYPKKVDREDAGKAWRQKVKPEEVAAIMARVELNKHGEWKDKIANKEKNFIPNPATWLRHRRWQDEILEGSRNGNHSAAAVRAAAGKYAAIPITRATA